MDNMKTDFSKVVFTAEKSRSCHNGPNGWSKGWVVQHSEKHIQSLKDESKVMWNG